MKGYLYELCLDCVSILSHPAADKNTWTRKKKEKEVRHPYRQQQLCLHKHAALSTFPALFT